MRFSTVATSFLASSAAAWHLPDFDWSNNGYRPIRSPAVPTVAPTNAPAASAPLATTAVASVVPAPTPVPDVASTKTSTAAGSANTGSSGLTADQQGALDAHNDARAEVGTADLVWDAALTSDAQAYADTLASSGTLEHSGISDQGENLYQGYGDETPLTNAVKSFLDEKSSYGGEAISSSNYMTFGHYTQCVWKSTTKVGMASATGGNGAVFVVARYQEPGNM
ncbi:PR-1-like protein [Corynespora cassiicola Philippines]|uniref:PR-1-like protein n=1 Tax=Corynespora cassiicola Philippines TaxID=1448308 RepID=A0A2T2PDC2_CORCC|nr:PR-1-like protein [Corynespora cassiicola Philippines]